MGDGDRITSRLGVSGSGARSFVRSVETPCERMLGFLGFREVLGYVISGGNDESSGVYMIRQDI